MVEQEMQRDNDDEHDDDGNNYLHRRNLLFGDEHRAATAAMSNAVLIVRTALSASLHDNSNLSFYRTSTLRRAVSGTGLYTIILQHSKIVRFLNSRGEYDCSLARAWAAGERASSI